MLAVTVPESPEAGELPRVQGRPRLCDEFQAHLVYTVRVKEKKEQDASIINIIKQ